MQSSNQNKPSGADRKLSIGIPKSWNRTKVYETTPIPYEEFERLLTQDIEERVPIEEETIDKIKAELKLYDINTGFKILNITLISTSLSMSIIPPIYSLFTLTPTLTHIIHTPHFLAHPPLVIVI